MLNREKRAAMDRTRPMKAKTFEVQRGAVALVLRKAVLGEFAVEVEHDSIACDLCNHAGGGDREAEPVASDQCRLLDGEMSNGKSVDQYVIRFRSELRSRCSHCFVRRAEDVQFVDFTMGHNCHRPMDVRSDDQFMIESLSLEMCELLRVTKGLVMIIAGEDNCSSDDRPG